MTDYLHREALRRDAAAERGAALMDRWANERLPYTPITRVRFLDRFRKTA